MKECWEALPAEIVHKSFCACEFSENTDGTEDDEIHCLKEGEVAVDAKETIHTETATLDAAYEAEESDPFADIEEDKDELENELVLDDC